MPRLFPQTSHAACTSSCALTALDDPTSSPEHQELHCYDQARQIPILPAVGKPLGFHQRDMGSKDYRKSPCLRRYSIPPDSTERQTPDTASARRSAASCCTREKKQRQHNLRTPSFSRPRRHGHDQIDSTTRGHKEESGRRDGSEARESRMALLEPDFHEESVFS